MIDTWQRDLDNKNFVVPVFLDLLKAFNAINHALLLVKLHHYKFSAQASASSCPTTLPIDPESSNMRKSYRKRWKQQPEFLKAQSWAPFCIIFMNDSCHLNLKYLPVRRRYNSFARRKECQTNSVWHDKRSKKSSTNGYCTVVSSSTPQKRTRFYLPTYLKAAKLDQKHASLFDQLTLFNKPNLVPLKLRLFARLSSFILTLLNSTKTSTLKKCILALKARQQTEKSILKTST